LVEAELWFGLVEAELWFGLGGFHDAGAEAQLASVECIRSRFFIIFSKEIESYKYIFMSRL